MKIYNVALIGCGHMGEAHLVHIYYQDYIRISCERKPTDVQMRCLIRMIEEGLPDRPTIDDVYASFEATMKAEEMIQAQMKKRGF